MDNENTREAIVTDTPTAFFALYDFGATDAQSRSVGASVTIRLVPAWENPGDVAHRCHAASHAQYFAFEPHAMRGPIRFGATPVRARKDFDTMAEARKYAAKYIASAAKRAHKQSTK